MKFKKSISFVLTLCMVLSLFATFVIPASAEPTNLVAGSTNYTTSQLFRQDETYAWNPDSPITYPDEDGKSLTDGVKEAANFWDAAWVGFSARCPEYQEIEHSYVTFDLGAVCEISSIVLYTFADSASGIAAPYWVNYCVSEDGENWSEIGYVDNGAGDLVITFEKEASARYVKVKIYEYGWCFLSEVEIYGTAPVVEEPDVSVEPATIVPTTLNSYGWTPDTEVLISTMSDSAKTVVDALGGAWFQWWTHVVADWSEADNAFVVTAVQVDVTDYETTALGEGRIVLSAWGGNATDSANNLRTIAVGDKLYLDGDFSALVDGTGAISGYTLSVNAPLAAPEEPEEDDTLTIEEAIALGESKEHNTYTEEKYYVTGVITKVYNETYGNMYIADENGNTITVYGTYSADGELRYDAMEVKPVAGDTVTVYGIVGRYNDNAQLKNAWITNIVVGDHEEEPEVVEPEADSVLSIEDAIALGESKDHNTYTAGKYYVTGVITEVYNETYGNMYITDENGNTITVYGTYSADGELRYDAMEVKPVAGDTVTVYGMIGQYNGNAQLKNAWITEHVPATPEAPVTSQVVTDWNPTSYKESVGGATGAFIYDDADIYANCANYWWIHAAFAPSATVEGGYEVVALRPSSGETVPFLAIPEGGFVWMAWSSAGDTPESSGAYALAFMSELAVGDVVFFNGVDFANHTTEADASAEVWVDPNAPVNVALNKDYTLSGEENATYNAKLTDGNAYGAMTYDNRWFAFTGANTVDKIGTVVVDLGALYDITAIQVNLVNDTGAGVAVPEYANLYVSEDGETWSEAIALTVSDANQVAYWAKAEELAVSAQYVKFEVKLGGTFAFLNEIEVYGKEAAPAPELNEVDGGELPAHNPRAGSLSIAANTAITYTVAFEHGANFNLWSEDVTVLVNGVSLEMGMLGYVATLAKGDTVTIVNAGAVAVEIYPSIAPVIPGTMSSPIVLDELGDITANVTEDIVMDGGAVFYTYTAPENGTLTITMPEGNWTYTVNNLTAGLYGDTQWSDSEDSSATTSIEVTAGDEIQIIVGTYDPEAWEAPVGELTFNAAFEAAKVTSNVVTDWNTSEWGGADEAHIFTNQEAYLACTHTWWSHVSFKPTNFEGVYEVVAIRGATGEAAAYEIAEGGFIWLAHDTAAEGTAGAYAHALIKTLAVGDLVKFTGIDVANCTTTEDATAEKWEAPKAPDVVDLKVSHNNLYNWGTFESMIISQPGKTVVDVISQTPYWWIMYVVEEVDGVYVATAYYKNCDEINTTVCPENGFLYYVYSDNSAWEVADEGKLLGYIFNLNDIDLSANMAIDTNVNPGDVKYITALNPEALKAGDVNKNGEIDATDYAIIRKLVLGTLTAEDIGDLAYSLADVNGDKVVNARDYYLVKRAFLGTYVIPGWEVKEDEAE